MIKYEDGIADVYLIKWPGFVVEGKKVTEEQAAEILIKTDCHMPNFKYAGNDRGLSKELNAICNVSEDYDYDKECELRDRMGILEIDLLANSQIVSSYIGGPHGWCDWDGNIRTSGDNIGKWPTVKSVAEEWHTIAQAFSYLDLECWLFNHESGYVEGVGSPGPVVKFVVSSGNVDVKFPDKNERIIVTERNIEAEALSIMFLSTRKRESGIEVDELIEKMKRLYGEIPQYK